MIKQMQSKITAAWARTQAYTRGWHCPEKILIIESDDWGSIRTSSNKAYQTLIDRSYKMHRSCWSADALETDKDLKALYELLDNYRDQRGNPTCFTGNMVMSNPDFSAIRKKEYKEYITEPVATTLASSSERKEVTQLWQQGMEKRYFRPQFHAREHIRWWQWLAALQQRSPEALETFGLQMCGLPYIVSKENQSYFQPPYIDSSLIKNSAVNLSTVIIDGIKLFEEQFGFKSLSTIAPNCAWTDKVEQIWATLNIRYIQGGFCQHFITDKKDRLIPHYLGQRSKQKGWYLVRNCTFEPAKEEKEDSWKTCLSQIERAFRFKTPAIISSHRVNYIGSIIKSNRTRGLNQLRQLLEEVINRWPKVLFLSSPELGYMIEHNIRQVCDLDGLDDKIFPTCPETVSKDFLTPKNLK